MDCTHVILSTLVQLMPRATASDIISQNRFQNTIQCPIEFLAIVVRIVVIAIVIVITVIVIVVIVIGSTLPFVNELF